MQIIIILTEAYFIVRVEDVDADGGGPDEYDMDDEEVDNKKDYNVEYDPTLAAAIAAASGGAGDGGHRVRAEQELCIDAGVGLGDGG
ncbi:unnamed protein product [Brassica napus]|uniref:(rape) hypothetical protein n=1 Tax=Brassica napus TaxID=3708 RepID=A0A817A6R3_BRANA|nr:unnamed protein product [Brassica napus]